MPATFNIPLIAILLATSCQSIDRADRETRLQAASAWADPLPLSIKIHAAATLKNPNPPGMTYVSMAIPFLPVLHLKKAIEAKTGLRLIDRDEAHITVLTPMEFGTLRQHLSMAEIQEAMQTVQIEEFRVLCLGMGQATLSGHQESTFFVVVDAGGLFARREELLAAYLQAGGDGTDFDPLHYYPHITVGFTRKDLHEQDGIIKDERSCIAALTETN